MDMLLDCESAIEIHDSMSFDTFAYQEIRYKLMHISHSGHIGKRR
jgi:hypothetical protein